MTTICPKCQYERQPRELVAETECPACGVIYDKYRPPANPAKPTKPTKSTDIKVDSPPKKAPDKEEKTLAIKAKAPNTDKFKLAFVGVLCLVIGYFGGREHLKYEMLTAITGAAEGFKQNMSKSFDFNRQDSTTEVNVPTTPETLSEPSPIKMNLLTKGFNDDKLDLNDAIIFSVSIENTGDRDIRAFDGSFIYTDLLGNVISKARMSIDDPLKAKNSITWSGSMKYNPFISNDRKLRDSKLENLKAYFETNKILFSDGEMVEW